VLPHRRGSALVTPFGWNRKASLRTRPAGLQRSSGQLGKWGGAANDRAASEAAGEGVRRRRRVKGYDKGPRPCGSATMQRSSAAAAKSQAVWPGTGARWSATQSAAERGGGREVRELSIATNVLKGQGEAKQRSRCQGVDGRQILEE
jgi:hypothetical protein